MAGHSKWANIKHRKGAQDKKKAKIFGRIIKELTVAAKEGGTDPEANPRLRLAIQNAKGANMPKDTMERAINKGNDDGTDYQEVTFEGYGPNGIAIFVECTTDNNNRTVSNIRSIFNKYNGSLGTNGSLEFIFDRKGVFTIDKESITDVEEFTLEAIDGGADDVAEEDDVIIVYTPFDAFGSMQKKLDELGIEAKNAELQRLPNNTTELDIESAKKIMVMIEKFEDDDDVQNVFHNLELTDELMEALSE